MARLFARRRFRFVLNETLILPVKASVALDWVRGKISDLEARNSPKAFEAILFAQLASVQDYRRNGLKTIWDIWRAGAVCFVCRTGIGSVSRYVLKRGGVAIIKERNPEFGPSEFCRYIIPPADFKRWMDRLQFPVKIS